MSLILPRSIDEIPLPFVIVCEGFGDARFLNRLLEDLQISNCNVGCPSRESANATGKGAIKQYLSAVRTSMLRGKANLRGIAVVADADENADVAFAEVIDGLKYSGFDQPSRAFAIEDLTIRTATYIMPGPGRTGTLEDMLWDAVVGKTPGIEGCMTQFSSCLGAKSATAKGNDLAKMRMSALVGATCQKNPWASVAMMWSDPDNPVPLNSPCFDGVRKFLRGFIA